MADIGQLIDRLFAHMVPKGSHPSAASDEVLARVANLAAVASAQPVTFACVRERVAKYCEWRQLKDALAELPQPAQRSEEWHSMRNNLVTASDFAQALGKGKFGTQKDFIIKKVDLPAFNASMPPLLWGVKYEPIAAAIYERRHSVALHEFGLLPHPTNPIVGASPDGITDLGIMLEIKCPWRRQIVAGSVPEQYAMQIQVQLDVCDLDECDYQEVKLSEYETIEEFLEDGGPGMLTADGNEKGATITIPRGADPPENEYPDPVIREWTGDELLAWDAEACSRNPHARLVLWRLDQMQIIRVHRDPEFMGEWIPKLEEVWGRVLAYRADREVYATEILHNKRKPVCMLLSDDEN